MKVCRDKLYWLLRFSEKNSGPWDECDHAPSDCPGLPGCDDAEDVVEALKDRDALSGAVDWALSLEQAPEWPAFIAELKARSGK